jgi:hypothetical protein
MKLTLIWEKLKREWKSFALQMSLLVAAAWELAAEMGADLPSLFNFLPEKYKAGALFTFALVMLLVRKYTPTTVEPPQDPK